MLRKKTTMRRFLFVLCTVGISMTASAAEDSLAADTSAFQQYLDSLGLNKNDLESKVRSTLMFGGSSPVSFFGEARMKMQYHHFSDYAQYLTQDRSYLQSNWEGNESFVRIGMVARAGRNATLWSKIGFQHTLPGTFINKDANGLVGYPHDKAGDPAIIHEDMCAGLAIRTVPASFWLKLGAIHWIEASPLSVWKSQPRTFAWEYLPFEVEQPISRYYEYNIAKGEKSGRAAWNKKAFQGINFESISLPKDLYLNLFYGSYERYDNFEREYGDIAADQSYSADGKPKGKGIGDPFRRVFHARLAAVEFFNKLTPGLNFLRYNYNEDVIKSSDFAKGFKKNDPSSSIAITFGEKKVGSQAFFKEPWVASVDLRGPISEKLAIQADFALSQIDTSFFKVLKDSVTGQPYIDKSNKWSDLRPAFYTHIANDYGIPLEMDLAVIGTGFYSPLSFAAPVDVFYPFGSNLLGPGKFVGRGEASPYTQNMAGINLKYVPKLTGYGHLRITYGQHFQLKSSNDVIYFPYRLNGQDLFSFMHSSYNRWGNDLIDHSLDGKYKKRLGDESYKGSSNGVGYEGGGLRSDYLAMYESFVPYSNSIQASANLTNAGKGDTYRKGRVYKDNDTTNPLFSYVDTTEGKKDTLYSSNAFVPSHQKFTFNLELDYSYDISKIVGYSGDLFFSVYAALNGISTSFVPLSFNEKKENMLLWGTYIRFEPAIALTKKFYLLGLAGFERWASDKAYTELKKGVAVNTPIDYRDYAVGVGFDWDMLSRVGLHARVKYMQHDDIHVSDNNYKTPVISTEIKMWF